MYKRQAVISLGIAFWTPDTTYSEMRAKYGGAPSQFLELGEVGRVHFRDQGLRSGRTIVLVHGTSASLHTWEPLVAKLKNEFRLVSFDLPGHGLTGENKQRDYSHAAMYGVIWRLMDHLEIDSATLAGNSLGGAVAWLAALDRPEKVDALILLAPSGAPSDIKAKSNIGFKIMKTAWGKVLMTKITPRFLVMKSLLQTVENKEIINDAVVDRYWELLRMKGNRQAMVDLAQIPRVVADRQLLSKVSQPTLIVWGREDGLLPFQMSVIFSNEIANSHLVALDNIGHIPMEEDVDSVSREILEFCVKRKC